MVACAVTETKCPLLTALFFSLSSLRRVTFLPEGVIVGFRNFAWGFNSQKKRFGVEKNPGDLRMMRKVMGKKTKLLNLLQDYTKLINI